MNLWRFLRPQKWWAHCICWGAWGWGRGQGAQAIFQSRQVNEKPFLVFKPGAFTCFSEALWKQMGSTTDCYPERISSTGVQFTFHLCHVNQLTCSRLVKCSWQLIGPLLERCLPWANCWDRDLWMALGMRGNQWASAVVGCSLWGPRNGCALSGKVGKKKREMKGNPWIKKGKVGKEGERKRGNKRGRKGL